MSDLVRPRTPLEKIAARINEHLVRFENDPLINRRPFFDGALLPYYCAGAVRAGNYVDVRYVSFQLTSRMRKAEAEAYLAWLDAGNVGTHYAYEWSKKKTEP